MESWIQDARYALRTLVRTPGFTAVAVISLALGIGVNTAVFSVINAVVLQPWPITDPASVIAVYTSEEGNDQIDYAPASYPDYVDYRERNETFSGVAAYAMRPMTLGDAGQSDLILGEIVSGNYFEVMGVRPALGRGFLPAEDAAVGSGPVAVLGHQAWQRRFAGDPTILGRSIEINGHAVTIVGVAPEGFGSMSSRNMAAEVFLPLSMRNIVVPRRDMATDRAGRWLWVAGRLKPGTTVEQASANLATIAGSLEQAYPDTNEGRAVRLLPLDHVKIHPAADGALSAASAVLMVVVGFVLLIACANVANLLLARAAPRRKEIAIRLAIGASRVRIVRQLLTESIVLAGLGGVLGLGLSAITGKLLVQALGRIELSFPVQLALDLQPDGSVLAFTALVSVMTGVVFGLAPALRSVRGDLSHAVKGDGNAGVGTSRRSHLRDVLVVVQVATSVVLLIGAGLFLRSLQQAGRIDPGFEVDRVLAASLPLDLRGLGEDDGPVLYDALYERLATIPGARTVALTSHVPLSMDIHNSNALPEGVAAADPRDWPAIDTAVVGPGFFDAMEISILRGRGFVRLDDATAPRVVVVNDTFAERYWSGQDPIGRHVRLGTKDEDVAEVIGVVETTKYRTLGEGPRPYFYESIYQNYQGRVTLLVRAAGAPEALARPVRDEIRAIDAGMPVFAVGSLAQRIGVALLLPRAGALLFGIFGMLGLVLATLGVYGVMSYLVSQSTREIGIRLSLGARPVDVLSQVMRTGLTRVGVGVGLGLAAAFGVTRALRAVLYGVTPTDTLTFCGTALFLFAVAAVACAVPARRASRVDPMVALRHD